MKVLIIGGSHQGKTAYAREKFPAEQIVLGALHKTVREQGDSAAQEVISALEQRESWVVVCDEVGCGPVPAGIADREYREAVGRLCCRIAAMADTVVRVVSGIPVAIKGERL